MHDAIEMATRFGLDMAGMALILGVAVRRRVLPVPLASTLLVFNVGLLCVVQVLTRVEFSSGAGFGLFAVLSIIRLRSELFGTTQLAFVFATLSASLLAGVGGLPLPLAAALMVVLAGVTAIVGQTSVVSGSSCCTATLDLMTGDDDAVIAHLGQRLHLDVVGYTLLEVDTVRETMTVEVRHRAGSPREASPAWNRPGREPGAATSRWDGRSGSVPDA